MFTDKLKGKELMKEIILLKDGEIVLKGLNRRTFEDVLKRRTQECQVCAFARRIAFTYRRHKRGKKAASRPASMVAL